MEEKIIAERFAEWAKSKDAKESRIAVFEHIRDIPYAIIPAFRDPVSGPAGMLKANKGACGPKHLLLAQMFAKLGIPVKYATYSFYWNDPAIYYPPELRRLSEKMPLTGHLACKARIQDKWVLIDATWDIPLEKAGYPVNKTWDGVSDTKCAVTYIKEAVHDSLEERLAYDVSIRNAFNEEEKAVYAEFILKLNAWLDTIRLNK